MSPIDREDAPPPSPEVTFQGAAALGPDRLWLTAALDALPERSYATRMFEYDRLRPSPWRHRDLPWRDVALARYVERPGSGPAVCAVSDEGQVHMITAEGTVQEDIPGAGLVKPGAKRHGHVLSVRQTGDHLYASGAGGQVYRRSAPGRWDHMDDGLLQPGDGTDRLLLYAVGGPAEDDLYAAGDIPGHGSPGRLYHWNGSSWRQLQIPPVRGLNAIFTSAGGRVWLAGLRGALLAGDHRAGFRPVLSGPSPHLFHDVLVREGVVYLASNHGLFRHDPDRRAAVRVRTGLDPELSYVSRIQAFGDVLWCVGPKDVARFDGSRWARIHHPDNPVPR